MQNRSLILPLAMALSVLTAAAACSGQSAPRVNSEAAHVLVEAGATLLDVRTEGEWGAGHLPGAVLVPVAELGSRMSEVPRDHPVVVYCQSGMRSARASAMLSEAGYEVHDLGAMANW